MGVSSPAAPEPGSAFLVERYLTADEAGALSVSIGRLSLVCADPTATGLSVRYLHSTFVPTEETCFCVFEAASIDAVEAVNRAAGFRFDRISAAIAVPTRPNPQIQKGSQL